MQYISNIFQVYSVFYITHLSDSPKYVNLDFVSTSFFSSHGSYNNPLMFFTCRSSFFKDIMVRQNWATQKLILPSKLCSFEHCNTSIHNYLPYVIAFLYYATKLYYPTGANEDYPKATINIYLIALVSIQNMFYFIICLSLAHTLTAF